LGFLTLITCITTESKGLARSRSQRQLDFRLFKANHSQTQQGRRGRRDGLSPTERGRGEGRQSPRPADAFSIPPLHLHRALPSNPAMKRRNEVKAVALNDKDMNDKTEKK